jgi:hypothetical protein
MVAKNRDWTPIAKRLPKWGETVIVAYQRYDWSNKTHKYRKRKRLGVEQATFWGDDWPSGPRFTTGPDDVVEEPIAWMPLPEPPSAL